MQLHSDLWDNGDNLLLDPLFPNLAESVDSHWNARLTVEWTSHVKPRGVLQLRFAHLLYVNGEGDRVEQLPENLSVVFHFCGGALTVKAFE